MQVEKHPQVSIKLWRGKALAPLGAPQPLITKKIFVVTGASAKARALGTHPALFAPWFRQFTSLIGKRSSFRHMKCHFLDFDEICDDFQERWMESEH